jgi:hypothetical protein
VKNKKDFKFLIPNAEIQNINLRRPAEESKN